MCELLLHRLWVLVRGRVLLLIMWLGLVLNHRFEGKLNDIQTSHPPQKIGPLYLQSLAKKSLWGRELTLFTTPFTNLLYNHF